MAKKTATRFNPPPNWKVKKGFVPPQGWQPDPAWGPVPMGWPMYVTESKKTHRLRNFLVLPVGAIIAIAVIVQLAQGGSSSPTVAPAAASPSSVALAARVAKPVEVTPSATVKVTAKATPKPTAVAKAAGIGDEVSVGDFDFVVHSFKCGVKNVGGEFGSTAQGQFCLVKLSITNHANDANTFDDSSQYLYDTEGRKFSVSTDADISVPGDDVFLADINPGNTVNGTIVFDVPTAGFTASHLALVSGFGFSDTPVNVNVS